MTATFGTQKMYKYECNQIGELELINYN